MQATENQNGKAMKIESEREKSCLLFRSLQRKITAFNLLNRCFSPSPKNKRKSWEKVLAWYGLRNFHAFLFRFFLVKRIEFLRNFDVEKLSNQTIQNKLSNEAFLSSFKVLVNQKLYKVEDIPFQKTFQKLFSSRSLTKIF